MKNKDLICNTYFPFMFRKNRGFFASLELCKRGKRKIINWGIYKNIGLFIETVETK